MAKLGEKKKVIEDAACHLEIKKKLSTMSQM
jgi:hypothetical protein